EEWSITDTTQSTQTYFTMQTVSSSLLPKFSLNSTTRLVVAFAQGFGGFYNRR
ncbi:hypothetical protein BaRGS_00030018, partial [Batillaria attramentaria]